MKMGSTELLGQFSFSPYGPWITGIVKMDSG